MCKRTVLIRDVVRKYHNYYRRNPEAVAMALRHPRRFNVEYLIEECFAHLGKYSYTDTAHCDYSDGSDSKTASIRTIPAAGNSYRGEISGVSTSGGGLKQGSLRCVIYNPHTDSLMYYLLPKSWWSRNLTLHPTTGAGKIIFTYNKTKDTIPRFEQYRVSSFRRLALA